MTAAADDKDDAAPGQYAPAMSEAPKAEEPKGMVASVSGTRAPVTKGRTRPKSAPEIRNSRARRQGASNPDCPRAQGTIAKIRPDHDWRCALCLPVAGCFIFCGPSFCGPNFCGPGF